MKTFMFTFKASYIGHMRVEHIASMSWRRGSSWRHSCLPSRHHILVIWELSILLACLEERRLCEHSWLPSRHHLNEDCLERFKVDQDKCKEWYQVDQHTKHRRCTLWDHVIPWYGKLVHYALCTNPWCMCVVFLCEGWDLSVGSRQREDYI